MMDRGDVLELLGTSVRLREVIVCHYVIYNNHTSFQKNCGFSKNLRGFA